MGKPALAFQPVRAAGSSSHANSQDMFDVFVAKEDFKFSSSHFVAYDGFRERLHGHNYSCSIRLKGEVRAPYPFSHVLKAIHNNTFCS